MRKIMLHGILLCLLLPVGKAGAIESPGDKSQWDYERSIKAVVRNKIFYKAGKLELMGTAGVMPYDSVLNHTLFGGRLTWHLGDHYGWEILDAQLALPTVTSFTTNLVKSKGITNLQTVKLRTIAATNFMVSPIYGKLRLLGFVTHLDMYFTVGAGLANTETLRVATTSKGVDPTETSLGTNWDPMFSFGVGIKIFLNRAMGLVVDLRDYVVHSETYGGKSLKSNFSVFAGLSFFIPPF